MKEREFLEAWRKDLEKSEWQSAEDIKARQRVELERIIWHAKETSPFYRHRLDVLFPVDGEVDLNAWPRVPLMHRDHLFTSTSDIISAAPPLDHGPVQSVRTSGSSGRPVTVWRTRRFELSAFGLIHRWMLWHDFDVSAKMAYIVSLSNERAQYPDGERYEYWTVPTQLFEQKGELVILNINTPVERQIAWLHAERPRYLHTFPTNARALARFLRKRGETAEYLEAVLLVGETLTPDVRELCESAFGARIIDRYGAVETSQIALQCPLGDCYHIQSESVLVELLRDDGSEAASGETGRVTVTVLGNYAFPLIRYQLDDYAVRGNACPCGRGLPTIDRILGRSRNMFRFPDGSEIWPGITRNDIIDLIGPRQWQIAQIAPMKIEVRYVPADPTFQPDFEGVTAYLRELLHQPVNVQYKQLEAFPALTGGKFHDYVCELPSANSC